MTRWSDRLAPWLFLLPALGLIIGFLAYPLGRSLYLALHKTAGPQSTVFVGFDNVRFLAQDALFWTALGNTVLYAVVFVGLNLLIALGLALLLEARRSRVSSLVRLLLFAPHLVGAVYAAMIAAKLFQARGTLNTALGLTHDWLRDPATAMAMIVVVALWLAVGFSVVYLQAALQGVDRTLLEAARIDGANAWNRFRCVTWPAIRPTVALLALVGLIGALQVFELPYLLAGDRVTTATLTLGLYLYQQGFEQGSLGYAAAVGWAMALIVAAASLLLSRFQKGAWS